MIGINIREKSWRKRYNTPSTFKFCQTPRFVKINHFWTGFAFCHIYVYVSEIATKLHSQQTSSYYYYYVLLLQIFFYFFNKRGVSYVIATNIFIFLTKRGVSYVIATNFLYSATNIFNDLNVLFFYVY